MTPTAAARATQPSTTLRDRLKDASLLREQCYIDGAWVGTPALPVNNPATGVELAKVAQLGAADAVNNWTVGGIAVTNAAQSTLTATGTYAANSNFPVAITVPFTTASGTLISNTINYVATAN